MDFPVPKDSQVNQHFSVELHSFCGNDILAAVAVNTDK